MNKKVALLATLGVVSSAALVAAFAAVPNNTYVRLTSSDIPTLDPGQIYDTASGEVGENLYETLVSYKGKSITEVEGTLATDWKESNGGKTYTFNLRKGVKFHSGNAMSCDDAAYSIRRNLVTNNAESGNWFISETLLGTGSNAKDEPSITWDKISKAVACNSSGQLVLTLPKADPATLVKLAYTGQSVVDSKHAASIGEWDGTEKTWKDWIGKDLTDSNLSKKPSGTGAYQLVKNEPNLFVAKSFADYWGDKPKIENVILQIVKELPARIEALKKGDADIIDSGPRAAVIPQLEGVKGVTIYDGLTNNASTGIMMNQNIKNPEVLGSGKLDGAGIPGNFFSDANVRRGFSYAFGYEQYVKEALLGKAVRRGMALPETFFGYDTGIKPLSFSPEIAKGAFQKAFGGQVWKNGFTLKARYRAGSVGAQTAMEILKKNVEALNPKFKVELSSKPWSDFLKDSAQGKEAMIMIGWAPDYADPDNFLYTFYHSEGFYHPRLNFKDSAIDKFLEQARATTDRAKRKALYSLVGRRASEIQPFIIMPMATGFLAYNSSLKGIEENYNNMNSGLSGNLWKLLAK
jgi:peptide/nickel transport system substrate-binding protein